MTPILRQISLDITSENERCIVYLVEPLPERFRCPLCMKLMRNPVQTIRGELACENCYKSNIG